MNEYLTETELTERLKISRQTLLALRRDGLPYRKVRGAIRYVPEEIDTWLSVHCQGKSVLNDEKKES
jgi:hypothetical protein